MKTILNELNIFNESYILDRYQEIGMEIVDINLLTNMNKLQKYELQMNQNYQYVQYNNLKDSIINFSDIKKDNISFDELLEYINERLSTKVSLDRRYLFQELLLNFSEQKNKLHYSKVVIELLKELIINKFDNNTELTFLLMLYFRFFILSQKFKIEDKEFVINANNKLIESLQGTTKDFFLIAFFRYFFCEFDKKMIYYLQILDLFNKYTEHLDKHILNNYNPINNYASVIAVIYEKIKDYNKKIYFYKKEIDNTLLYFQEIKVKNALIDQTIIKDNLDFSNKIQEYKSKELKEIAIKLADLVSKNHDEIFIFEDNKEFEQIAQDYYNKVKEKYLNEITQKDKIEHLLFCFFHFNYCNEHFEIYKNNEDNNFIEMFSPSATVADHLGFFHNVKNKDTFTFFRNSTSLNNQILVVLDRDTNWVDISTKIILEDIPNLKMLKNYEKQYINTINNFKNGLYMEFMYIAPILIERVLKNYLIQINGNVKTFRADSIVDKTLSQIIEVLKEDENCYIDKYLLRYFAFVLVDNEGLNMRNHISHGNYSDNYFCKEYAMYIYVILIYLIRYFSNDQG